MAHIITGMTNVNAQLTLQTWMSAAFPIGSFSCSHGLESAIADRHVHDAESTGQWIATIIEHGSAWNDAVLLTSAYQAVSQSYEHDEALSHFLNPINDIALALCTGAERLHETTLLGQSFATAAAASTPLIPAIDKLLDSPIALPVAIGTCGALANIPLTLLLPASIQATSSNLVWICTRLVPLGQSQALNIISNLQATVSSSALRASSSSLDDLGSCALLADLASIQHEELHSRICIT